MCYNIKYISRRGGNLPPKINIDKFKRAYNIRPYDNVVLISPPFLKGEKDFVSNQIYIY